jgi:hypothetical protein
MSFKSILLFAGAALASSILHRDVPGRSCGAPKPSEEFLQVNHELALEEAASARETNLLSSQLAATVDVYLHTVASTQAALLSVYLPRVII